MSKSKMRKAVSKAKDRARQETPKPVLLAWAIRQILYYQYGHRPYY